MGGQSRLSASLSSPDCHYPNVVYSPRGQLASRCLVFREQRDGNSGIEMEPSRPSFRDSSPSLQKSLPVQVTTPMCALLTERGTHQTNELSAFASVDFFFDRYVLKYICKKPTFNYYLLSNWESASHSGVGSATQCTVRTGQVGFSLASIQPQHYGKCTIHHRQPASCRRLTFGPMAPSREWEFMPW